MVCIGSQGEHVCMGDAWPINVVISPVGRSTVRTVILLLLLLLRTSIGEGAHARMRRGIGVDAKQFASHSRFTARKKHPISTAVQ